jgi:predicted ribosomally synthesized peptide with SipW-like signal peptide
MKKIGLICLAVVLGLGALGVGYAYWSDILTINGTVATGNFDTNFTEVNATDDDAGQDVATCTVSNIQDKSFTVTIGNGYPCYTGIVNFQIRNDGTIPAKIKSIEIDDVDYTGPVEKDLPGSATTATDISISVSGIAVGDSIAVGSSAGGALEVHVCSTENEGHDADENASGSFTVTIETIQFNAP